MSKPLPFYQSLFLVDDDTDDQEIFIEALKQVYPDVRCRCENDAESALNSLNNNPAVKPDLFFIDMNMPRINGKELLKKLKSSESLKDIPVIMYSTFFGDSDIKEIHQTGAAHHLLKSNNFNDLCKSLENILLTKW